MMNEYDGIDSVFERQISNDSGIYTDKRYDLGNSRRTSSNRSSTESQNNKTISDLRQGVLERVHTDRYRSSNDDRRGDFHKKNSIYELDDIRNAPSDNHRPPNRCKGSLGNGHHISRSISEEPSHVNKHSDYIERDRSKSDKNNQHHRGHQEKIPHHNEHGRKHDNHIDGHRGHQEKIHNQNEHGQRHGNHIDKDKDRAHSENTHHPDYLHTNTEFNDREQDHSQKIHDYTEHDQGHTDFFERPRGHSEKNHHYPEHVSRHPEHEPRCDINTNKHRHHSDNVNSAYVNRQNNIIDRNKSHSENKHKHSPYVNRSQSERIHQHCHNQADNKGINRNHKGKHPDQNLNTGRDKVRRNCSYIRQCSDSDIPINEHSNHKQAFYDPLQKKDSSTSSDERNFEIRDGVKRHSVDSTKSNRKSKSRNHSRHSSSNSSKDSSVNLQFKIQQHHVDKDKINGFDNGVPKQPSSTSLDTKQKEHSTCAFVWREKRRLVLAVCLMVMIIIVGLLVALMVVHSSRKAETIEEEHLYYMVAAHVKLRILNREYIPNMRHNTSEEFSKMAVSFCSEKRSYLPTINRSMYITVAYEHADWQSLQRKLNDVTINTIFLKSDLSEDFFGCTLQTLSSGSIKLYHVSPFLDTIHTSNITHLKEILVYNYKSKTKPSTKDSTLIGDNIVEISTINITLERYTTNELPRRPTLTTRDQQHTTKLTPTLNGVPEEPYISNSNIPTTTRQTNHRSGSLQTDDNITNDTIKSPKGSNTNLPTDGTTLDGTSNLPEGATNEAPLQILGTKQWQVSSPPVHVLPTVTQPHPAVYVTDDHVSLLSGEPAAINVQVDDIESIEEFTIKHTNHNGHTVVLTTVNREYFEDMPTRSSHLRKNTFVFTSVTNAYLIVALNFSKVECGDTGKYEFIFTTTSEMKFRTSAFLHGTEPAGKPSLFVPLDLVQNRETSKPPISCTANVGYPPGRIQWQIKPQGGSQFIPFENYNTNISGECNNFVTNSLIYTPTKEANGTLLKCVVVNEQLPPQTKLFDVVELHILPDDICHGIPNNKTIRDPFRCNRYIHCQNDSIANVHECQGQMCFDEQSGKCGQTSLTMTSAVVYLNEDVTKLKCRLIHMGSWYNITFSRLTTSGTKHTILTVTNGALKPRVYNSDMRGRVFTDIDVTSLYEVSLNIWVYSLACTDEGTYTCDVDAPFSVETAKGTIRVKAKPQVPKIEIPNQIIENLPMRKDIMCSANVGYPSGILVMKIKFQNETNFHPPTNFKYTAVQGDVEKCSGSVNETLGFVPSMEHNGMQIRCEVEGNSTLPLRHVLVTTETIYVIPANFCLIHRSDTPHVYPYDCNRYVQCQDGGSPHVKQCGSPLCYNPDTLMCDLPKEVDAIDPKHPCRPNKNGVYLPHPFLCNKYIWCVQGHEVVQHCARGTLYIDGGQCTFEPRKSRCFRNSIWG